MLRASVPPASRSANATAAASTRSRFSGVRRTPSLSLISGSSPRRLDECTAYAYGEPQVYAVHLGSTERGWFW